MLLGKRPEPLIQDSCTEYNFRDNTVQYSTVVDLQLFEAVETLKLCVHTWLHPRTQEVSKRYYSPKAKGFIVRGFLSAKNTVYILGCSQADAPEQTPLLYIYLPTHYEQQNLSISTTPSSSNIRTFFKIRPQWLHFYFPDSECNHRGRFLIYSF